MLSLEANHRNLGEQRPMLTQKQSNSPKSQLLPNLALRSIVEDTEEENEDENILRKSKYLCEHPTCTNKREYYCGDNHHVSFCPQCHMYHRYCKGIIEVKDLTEILEEFMNACRLIWKLQDFSKINACSRYLSEIDATFKDFNDKIYLLDQEIYEAILNDDFPRFEELKNSVDSIVLEAEENSIIRSICFHSIENRTNYDHFDQESIKFSDNVRLRNKVENLVKEDKKTIETRYNIKKEREVNAQIAGMKNEFNSKKRELSNELKDIQQDRDEIKQEFEETIDRILPKVDMDLSKEEGQHILDLFLKSCLRFPAVKSLNISNVSGQDQSLNTYFSNCAVESIGNFVFNYPYLNDKKNSIRFSFYRDNLLNSIRVTSHEVFLSNMIIKPQDLNDLVKEAASSKILIINHCKVETSDALDFQIEGDSSLGYLSFYNCGNSKWNNMHWDKDPSSFGHIITAIRRSPLRLSLKEINIKGCGIEKSQIDPLMDENLTHINIVNKNDNPCSC
ncbi:unnamed protein product [Moneuplotes crassus]|uniref:Uncharacterized protein n=1 Tax=Euplotes crassus TaxID=5936 RepID=A0AAD1U9A0_EUPCR|nr:unnamed protein product [Moneuplotes crassus]